MFFTVFNGRYSPRLNNTVGCIAKSLLLNSDISDKNKTLNQFFNELQETYVTLLGFEPNHFVYDYSKIENEFEFNYINMDNSDSELTDIIKEDCPGNAVRDSTVFYVFDYGDKIKLTIFYKGHIYSEEFISGFLNGIVELIQSIVENNSDKTNIGEFM